MRATKFNHEILSAIKIGLKKRTNEERVKQRISAKCGFLALHPRKTPTPSKNAAGTFTPRCQRPKLERHLGLAKNARLRGGARRTLSRYKTVSARLGGSLAISPHPPILGAPLNPSQRQSGARAALSRKRERRTMMPCSLQGVPSRQKPSRRRLGLNRRRRRRSAATLFADGAPIWVSFCLEINVTREEVRLGRG